jgi:predicted hydrocarbon binding protein
MSQRPSFRDRLAFDPDRGEYRDGNIRYLMIRPDALMGILKELPEAQRPDVLAAFARSITHHGGQSARTYRAAGAADAAALAATIERTAPELGWGKWTLAIGDGRMDLIVANSPFAAGYGPSATPVCHPILGMLRAVGPMVLGGPVAAAETRCAAQGAPDCRFEVIAVAGRIA